MKQKLRQAAVAGNLLGAVDLVRRLPDCIDWIRLGASGLAPAPIKRMIVTSYLRKYRLRSFVETGTHLGDTLAVVASNRSTNCVSIELSDGHYAAAVSRFRSFRNVRLIHGDSASAMPKVVAELTEPALFWLDGHYSGGTTARGSLETPISAELRAILASRIRGHVVLIDDARCFDGSHDYPHLDELLREIRADGRFDAEVSADVVRLTPKLRPRRDP